MTKQLLSLLLFSLLATLSLSQNCVGTLSDDLLQTGIIDVINPGNNGRQTLAQTPVLYQIPPSGFQTAFSFVNLQYNTSQGIHFIIRGGRIGATNFLGISLLLLQDRRWEKVRISYLVNSRNDTWVGSFSYSPYSLNSGQNNSGSLSTQIQGAVKGWEADTSDLVFLKAVFVSGLQTSLSNFSLFLTNVTFDKVRGIVGVTLSNSTRAVDLVTISYIIFISPHPRFIYDSFNYPGTDSVADYSIVGSSGFSVGGISGVRYYGINIESNLLNCQGSLCPSSCINKTSCAQANGIQSLNDCFICPNNTRFNQTRRSCVPIAITCGVNQQLINGTTCQCIFGFFRLGQLCVNRCGVNQEWNGNVCVCNRGSANITNVCRPCPPGSTPSANRTTCECSTGSVFDNNSLRCVTFFQCQENATGVIEGGVYRCRCNADFFVRGQACVFCPSPALWNTTSLTCTCPNPRQNFNGSACISCISGQIFNTTSRQCECSGSRILVSGECRCPNNLAWNNQTSRCECPNRLQTLNSTSNRCVCVPPNIRLETGQCGLVCPQNEWWSAGECKCKSPYVRINGRCTMTCPANQRWNGIECACVEGFFRINGSCATCTVGMFYNSTTKTCQNICGQNEVINGTQCICRQNFFRINGICSQCAAGTVYNATSQRCDSICKANQVFTSGSCVCVVNFVLINGTCGQCPAGTTYNTNTQICDSICKANETFDGTTCVCLPNFNRISGVCGQCVTGTVYNRTTQVCDSICRENQVFSGDVCICAQNFFRINGICSQCAVGTVYNTATAVCDILCKANQILDGTRCVCAPGFFLINGTCDKCPAGRYFDDSLKRCVIQPTCPTGAQWNQTRLQCQCLLANQYLIFGSCQSCVSNAAWNGTQCVCRSGFFSIDNECVTCDINSFYNATLRTCVCNRGFYGDRTLCQKCHATCGRCSGPNVDQCLDCVDVSFTLTNGVCQKPSSCVAGMYLSGSICRPCSAYCSSCEDENVCTQCTSGHEISSVVITPTITSSVCQEICGDGKRYEYACDDGNTNNGDGCSDQCRIQSGWSCSGGTTMSRSVCMQLIPSRSIITLKGAVQLSGKVMQGITLSYLPDGLTAGGCPRCSQVLLVSIIQAQVIPSFRINYLPTTQFKYLVEFDFQGIFGIPPFTFTVRINPEFSQYFGVEDMAQLITLRLDPAVLALGENVEDLTIEQILGQKIPIADGDLDRVFN